MKLPTVLLRAPTGARISTDRSHASSAACAGIVDSAECPLGALRRHSGRAQNMHGKCPDNTPITPANASSTAGIRHTARQQ